MRKNLDKMSNYGFNTKYSADEYGNVFFNENSKYHKIIAGDKTKSFINKYGYVEYVLSDKDGNKKHIQAHRVVASLFLPNPSNKHYVNHKDGNKLNNHISNLEWCTASENESHSFQILKKKVWNKGKTLPSGKEYRGKIRPVQCLSKKGLLVKKYFNPTEAEQDGFNLKQISAVCCGKQKTHKGYVWKYIEN